MFCILIRKYEWGRVEAKLQSQESRWLQVASQTKGGKQTGRGEEREREYYMEQTRGEKWVWQIILSQLVNCNNFVTEARAEIVLTCPDVRLRQGNFSSQWIIGTSSIFRTQVVNHPE